MQTSPWWGFQEPSRHSAVPSGSDLTNNSTRWQVVDGFLIRKFLEKPVNGRRTNRSGIDLPIGLKPWWFRRENGDTDKNTDGCGYHLLFSCSHQKMRFIRTSSEPRYRHWKRRWLVWIFLQLFFCTLWFGDQRNEQGWKHPSSPALPRRRRSRNLPGRCFCKEGLKQMKKRLQNARLCRETTWRIASDYVLFLFHADY